MCIFFEFRSGNILIDSQTGNLSLFVDREEAGLGDQMFVTLLATDSGSPPRIGVATCVVNVNGINDNLPFFRNNQKNVTVYVPEGNVDKIVFISTVSDFFSSA